MIPDTELQLLQEQLPFYVNGTLSPDLRMRIDAALPKSQKLREALAQERDIQMRIIAGTSDLLEASQPHFAEREAAVAKAVFTQPSAPERERKKTGLAAALSFLNPRRWNPALALTLALAVPAQAAIIASQTSTISKLEKENFELASGPCADRDRTGGIVIELVDDAQWIAVAKLLDTEALTISENGAFGVLTVRGAKKGKDRDALIERLTKSPLVSRAEPEA